MPRYIGKFAAESGYSEDAIRNKIQRGVWAEGQVWLRAPDRKILIDVEGFNRWAQRMTAQGRRPTDR